MQWQQQCVNYILAVITSAHDGGILPMVLISEVVDAWPSASECPGVRAYQGG